MNGSEEGGQGMSTPAPIKRPAVGVILRWSGVVVALGLLTFALLALPFRLYAVQTGSMQPTFGPRALVVVHQGEPVMGQPISFTHHGGVITHRLVSVNGAGDYLTKGDANETVDPWVVAPSEVIGGVVWSMPTAGYWLVYLKLAPGWGSILLSLVGLGLMWAIARELDDATEPGIKDVSPVRAVALEPADLPS